MAVETTASGVCGLGEGSGAWSEAGRKLADTKGTKEAGQVYEAGQRQRMRRVYASRWTRCRTAASKHSWS